MMLLCSMKGFFTSSEITKHTPIFCSRVMNVWPSDSNSVFPFLNLAQMCTRSPCFTIPSFLITLMVESGLNRSAKIPLARKRGSRMTSEASSGGESKYTHSPHNDSNPRARFYRSKELTSHQFINGDHRHLTLFNSKSPYQRLNGKVALGHSLSHVRVTQGCLEYGLLYFVNVFK